MTQINFSNNIRVSGRSLHLQTNTFEQKENIITTLFDGGRVLGKEELSYDSVLTEQALKRVVETFHLQQLESIELLYAISVRVKTVRHPLSLLKLGRQFLKWNLLDEAIGEFELALQYEPKYGEVYLNLSEAFLRRGALEEAIQILEKGVQIAGTYADIWYKLGIAFFKNKQYVKSKKMFDQSILINPHYDEPHLYLSILYLEIICQEIQDVGLPSKDECIRLAKENLGKAVTLSKRLRSATIQKVAQKLYKNHFQETLEILTKVQDELKPEVDLDFQDLFYLNFMYGEKGRDPGRIRDYLEKLNTLSKQVITYPDIHNHLGVAYLIQCRDLFNKAIREFRLACKLNSNYQRAEKNLKLTENDGKGFLILLRALLK